ncbi:thioredoxin family protein [Polaribacter sargassicola]|uniref:thioredoxin family protein n=1 Tax=Polaribacter sargassicola TaxID=2836891 RepID=UPI001F1C7F65|nr:thioredoxin fold domain-containing protein [Polaribacter sp. DS7-9]MCG1035994.1 thioredoxin family protein [Polaribacter sp. DS7-9]
MKKTLFFLSILVYTIQTNAQKINWMTLNEALELQKENPKNIIMDVYTNWCGPCKLLDKNTFQHKDVAAFINKNYYAVKFNGEGNEIISYEGNDYGNPNYDETRANKRNSVHQFANFMGINAYPTIVFIDNKGGLIMPLRGYYGPDSIELYLKLFKDDQYKKITNKEQFDQFNASFVPEFKVKGD